MVLIITNIIIITVSTITIIIVMFWTQRSSPVSVAPVLNHGPRKGERRFYEHFCCNNKEPKHSGS